MIPESTFMAKALEFLSYVNKTGSPYHSVRAITEMLDKAGFKRILEQNLSRNIERKGKYYVTRNYSSIMAVVVGNNFQEDNSGFILGCSHTDSPTLRVRPHSSISSENYQLLGVETYGSGLWHTWFDRGLGIAGKVTIKENEKLKETLIRIAKPLFIIPNLAIHLQNADERNAFKIDLENHLRPIVYSNIKHNVYNNINNDKINKHFGTKNDGIEDDRRKNDLARIQTNDDFKNQFNNNAFENDLNNNAILNNNNNNEEIIDYNIFIKDLIAKEINCKNKNDIIDWDLNLFDATPSRIAGIYDEFIESPRLDNLISVWASFSALIKSVNDLEEKSDITIAAAFDHEEIGSESFTGANSSIMTTWLIDILISLKMPIDNHARIIANSFLISADSAHGVHPNYSDKHQQQHKPLIHKGLVIKENANQRYCSNATSMTIARQIANYNHCLIQDVVVKNNSPCGSTIGPMTSARLGIRGIDIGIPQLSMHSIREFCGINDLYYLEKFFQSAFINFRKINNNLISL